MTSWSLQCTLRLCQRKWHCSAC